LVKIYLTLQVTLITRETLKYTSKSRIVEEGIYDGIFQNSGTVRFFNCPHHPALTQLIEFLRF
ncbi:MAG: hypothetical protein ACKO86_10860, partial [Dolichospermum sp.]